MKASALALAIVLLAGCESTLPPGASSEPGRITARPVEETPACTAGETRIELASGPDALLYVPEPAAGEPAPLLVFLHGAGGTAERMMARIRPAADEHAMIVLVPGSIGETWDGVRGTPRADAARIDEALRAAFARCAVDRRRIAVGGFSDGASYALTLGAANGDLVSHILAFSPCGISREIVLRSRPRVFISHGRADEVLPIDRCGRPIAAALQRAGYEVRYREFDGKHEIPDALARDAFSWFTERGERSGMVR